MHGTFIVFFKCTIQGGSKVDVLFIAFLHLWLTFCKGIDKYWIVPVRKLFYFHHWCGPYEWSGPPRPGGRFSRVQHDIIQGWPTSQKPRATFLTGLPQRATSYAWAHIPSPHLFLTHIHTFAQLGLLQISQTKMTMTELNKTFNVVHVI